MILLALAVVVFGAGAWMVLEYASVSRRQIAMNIRRAGSYAIIDAREQHMSQGARERLMRPAVRRLGEIAVRMSPAGKRVELARKLRSAGIDMNPQVLLAIKGGVALTGLAVALVGLVMGVIALFVAGVLGFIIGFLGPDFWLNKRIRKRRAAMERMLPDTLDLLTVSVQAGLGFDSAVAKVCEKMSGPLIEELDAVSHEIRVGETRRQALMNLGERVESDDVRSFSRSIIQAEELGTSLGRTLKVQADDMRIHRQLKAEEKAMKAPVKMLFPTVLFIFPAMFGVILGPAMLNILGAFSQTS